MPTDRLTQTPTDQRLHDHRARADVNQLGIDAAPLERAALLGHPNARHRRAQRAGAEFNILQRRLSGKTIGSNKQSKC